MKKIFFAIAITSFINVFAQEKELTLEDAVLSRSKGLTPKNMSGLKWIKGTNNYIYK